MAFFGHIFVSTATIRDYEADIDRLKMEASKNKARITELEDKLFELQAQYKTAMTERNEAINKLLLAQADKNALQIGITKHNGLLKIVSDHLVSFQDAWKFRRENPKMGPKLRAENIATLETTLDAIDASLPTRVVI